MRGDVVERAGLRHRAWEPVEDVATTHCVGLAETLANYTHHDLVADQTALVHHLLGHQAQLGSFTNGGTQHVARADVRHDEMARQPHALCALASALAPEQDQPGARDHFRKPS